MTRLTLPFIEVHEDDQDFFKFSLIDTPDSTGFLDDNNSSTFDAHTLLSDQDAASYLYRGNNGDVTAKLILGLDDPARDVDSINLNIDAALVAHVDDRLRIKASITKSDGAADLVTPSSYFVDTDAGASGKKFVSLAVIDHDFSAWQGALLHLTFEYQSVNSLDSARIEVAELYASGLYLQTTTQSLSSRDIRSASKIAPAVVTQDHVLAAQNIKSISKIASAEVGQTSVQPITYYIGAWQAGYNPNDQQVIAGVGAIFYTSTNRFPGNLASVVLNQLSASTDYDVECVAVDDEAFELRFTTESFTTADQPVHNLTSSDIKSASKIQDALVYQAHVLAADSIKSASKIAAAVVTQDHVLTADDIKSASKIQATPVVVTHILTADNIKSASMIASGSLALSGRCITMQDASTITQVSAMLEQLHVIDSSVVYNVVDACSRTP